MIQNSKGTRFYGMHFYPGVAEYQEEGGNPYRVFLNEDTIRSMDESFTGRPVFVHHVESDDISPNVDKLRQEADGWVIRSFYNAADGKHWVEFLVVSERGLRAIKNGMRLSNAYLPKRFAAGGLWNGVQYAKEITSGEYEHLAIVPNPRYEESVVLTPEKFKQYNEEKNQELLRIANAKEGNEPMKLNLFKRAKVENAVDIEGMSVVLPKSGKEVTISQLVLDRDAAEEAAKGPQIANGLHLVAKDSKLTVAELIAENEALKLENAKMKKNDPDDSVVEPVPVAVNEDDTMENEEEEMEEDEEAAKKKKKDAKKNADEEDKAAEMEAAKKKKEDAKKKANALRNAGPTGQPEEVAVVEFPQDQVARGKARYGS